MTTFLNINGESQKVTYHQKQHLKHHGRSTAYTTTQSPFKRSLQIELEMRSIGISTSQTLTKKKGAGEGDDAATHVDIRPGIDPSLDKDDSHCDRSNSPEYPPSKVTARISASFILLCLLNSIIIGPCSMITLAYQERRLLVDSGCLALSALDIIVGSFSRWHRFNQTNFQ